MKILKRYNIFIPKDISIIYSELKKILIISGTHKKKALILKTKLIIKKNTINVTRVSFQKISNDKKKKLKMVQGTTYSLIKQTIIEVSTALYSKLKLIGVGYKTFPIFFNDSSILQFKLGYSHSIYFKVIKGIQVFCKKATILYIFGDSYQRITQYIAQIRSYRSPDPYKGKGVLYHDEIINLKEGKKI